MEPIPLSSTNVAMTCRQVQSLRPRIVNSDTSKGQASQCMVRQARPANERAPEVLFVSADTVWSTDKGRARPNRGVMQ